VDTCSAEFEPIPLLLLHYESEDEVRPSDRKKVMILGEPEPDRQGSNSITAASMPRWPCGRRLRDHHGEQQPGDGLHRLRHSDRLYFEPLTREDVLNIVEKEKPWDHRPVRWANPPEPRRSPGESGVPILGTSPDSIDRPKTGSGSSPHPETDLIQPQNGTATSFEEARSWPGKSATPSWCGPLTFWRRRWRSSTMMRPSSVT